MRNSLFDKVTTFSQRLAARGHAQRSLNHARFKRQQGATALEYAIIAGIIAVVIVAVFGTGADGQLGEAFGNVFDKVSNIVSGSTKEGTP